MDKMLVGSTSDLSVTNDGATILKELDVEHAIAKMTVDVSKSADNEAGDGDGTKSVVLLLVLEGLDLDFLISIVSDIELK